MPTYTLHCSDLNKEGQLSNSAGTQDILITKVQADSALNTTDTTQTQFSVSAVTRNIGTSSEYFYAVKTFFNFDVGGITLGDPSEQVIAANLWLYCTYSRSWYNYVRGYYDDITFSLHTSNQASYDGKVGTLDWRQYDDDVVAADFIGFGQSYVHVNSSHFPTMTTPNWKKVTFFPTQPGGYSDGLVHLQNLIDAQTGLFLCMVQDFQLQLNNPGHQGANTGSDAYSQTVFYNSKAANANINGSDLRPYLEIITEVPPAGSPSFKPLIMMIT